MISEVKNGYVFFNKVEDGRTFAGGLEVISSEDKDSRTSTGIVVAADPATNLKEGDKFIYTHANEFQVHVNNEINTVVSVNNIIAKIK